MLEMPEAPLLLLLLLALGAGLESGCPTGAASANVLVACLTSGSCRRSVQSVRQI